MNDGGKKLRELIYCSNDAEITWEIPKGGKHEHETNIDCAMREFTEETCIPHTKYKILHDISPTVETINDNGSIYQHYYYVAKARDNVNIEPKINFSSFAQISEVGQIKWVSLEEIKFMNLSKSDSVKLKSTFLSVVKKFKRAHKMLFEVL